MYELLTRAHRLRRLVLAVIRLHWLFNFAGGDLGRHDG